MRLCACAFDHWVDACNLPEVKVDEAIALQHAISASVVPPEAAPAASSTPEPVGPPVAITPGASEPAETCGG
jgi:hypothetical protein